PAPARGGHPPRGEGHGAPHPLGSQAADQAEGLCRPRPPARRPEATTDGDRVLMAEDTPTPPEEEQEQTPTPEEPTAPEVPAAEAPAEEEPAPEEEPAAEEPPAEAPAEEPAAAEA